MNSVAGQLVATMMNSTFNAQQTISNTQTQSSQEFSKVFDQVNSQSYGGQGEAVTRQASTSNETETVAPYETVESPKDTQVDTTKVQEDALDDKVNEVTEENADEAANMVKDVDGKETETVKADTTAEVTEEEVAQDLTEVEITMEALSEILGISPEALQSIMEANDIDLSNLQDNRNLITIVQESLGLDDQTALVLDEQALTTFKEVQEAVNNLYESLDTNPEQLAEAIRNYGNQEVAVEEQAANVVKVTEEGAAERVMVNNGSSSNNAVVSETAKTTETATQGETQIEVVDLRESSQTVKYGQQNQQGQQQGQQTFGEFMAQQVTQIKGLDAGQAVSETEYQQISAKEVIDQIVTKAIVNLSDEKTSMQLQLNPHNLGKVAVSVTAEQGAVKGQFIAENQVVKEMLEANLIQLKEQLEEQGIKVDKIEVTVGNANDYFDQRQQDQNQNQPGNKRGKGSSGRINRLMDDESELETTAGVAQTPDNYHVTDEYTVEYSA